MLEVTWVFFFFNLLILLFYLYGYTPEEGIRDPIIDGCDLVLNDEVWGKK